MHYLVTTCLVICLPFAAKNRMKVLIHTAHVEDGHKRDNVATLPDFALIAPCRVVMIQRAELMHCCKAAS
jgi:hypothetical protein